MIQKYDYRKSFDAAHRIKNKKKTIKEIWPKQNLFPNKSPKVTKSQKTPYNYGFKNLKKKQKQKQGLQGRNDQLDRNVESRKLKNDSVSKTIRRLENNLKSGKGSQKKSSEGIETSCVLTKAEVIIPLCDNDKYNDCGKWALDGYCTNSTFISNEDGTLFKDWMIKNCRKSCDACPPPVPLFDSQIQYKEYDNNTSTFNLQLNVTTDDYGNETSWTFASRDSEDSIFDSSEVNITSQLENNAEYRFNYYCIIPQTKENQQTDDKTSTCYNFEVHDSYGDGMCCEYGYGSFSIYINTNSTSLKIEDEFKDGISMISSFCINHDSGKIESEGTASIIKKEQPTYSHYPFRWQCKNGLCTCDSKPRLTSNIHKNHIFLLDTAMLSGPDKLQDVESAQYKAACWVLFDDPFEYNDLEDEGAHNRRMMQRYILAVLYFATSPEKWRSHYDFLSSRSECD